MSTEARSTFHSVILPSLAAFTFLAGAMVFVANIVHHSIPRIVQHGLSAQGQGSVWTDFLHSSSPWFLALALITGVWTVYKTERKPGLATDVASSDKMFSAYLIGLGYFLLVDAIVTMVAITGLAATGQLDDILKHGATLIEQAAGTATEAPKILTPEEARRGFMTQAVILGLSLAMAILGALFYFANSLWAKFGNEKIMFNRNVFWAGLWFRLAEAVVFTLAFFLALRFYADANTLYLMPMVGLFVGMTVKSAEALVFGIAERTLAAAVALVSPPGKKAPEPGNAAAPNAGAANPNP